MRFSQCATSRTGRFVRSAFAAFASLCTLSCMNLSVAIAQENAQAWTELERMPQAVENASPWIRAPRAASFAVDLEALKRTLNQAPLEQFPIDPTRGLIIAFPHPTDGFKHFRIVESPIMEPALAAQFPEIKTYAGQGIDDPAAIIRLDVTPQGFHSMVLSPEGDYFTDPYSKGDVTHYGVYFKRDYFRMKFHSFSCTVLGEEVQVEPSYGERASGNVLSTFRIAVAATGEYTAFHGGTVALGQAAIVTAMNRVNGLYERDLAIRMVLIANNSNVVYTNAATDPFTNNNGGTLLTQNQNNMTTVIGSANYDIGHIFSTGGGGVAVLGSVCSSASKAQGVTGSSSPTGDPFWIDYVAHEIGHQFGAGHSFNSTTSSCNGNRSSANAYEPGSGTTIMSYAGICGADNVQSNSDVMFNFRSYDQIRTFVTGGSAACRANTNTGNSAPSVDAGLNFTIPIGTAFNVTAASASDANGDSLTYSWEQADLGVATSLATADNGTSPIFRVFNPSSSNFRTFPRYSNVLSNTLPVGEMYPAATRTLDLRLTVRDNRAGGGGVNADAMVINVNSGAGPFVITSPVTNVLWNPGVQTVTWNVANTTAAPVNCANVRILLSTDGGNTWPTVLLASTPNDGSQQVTIPNLTTGTARIRIEAVNNIFFDVSTVNFRIQGATNPPQPSNVAATPNPLCAGSSATLSGTVGANQTIDWFTGSCGGTPIGTGTSLSVSPSSNTTYFARARDLSSGLTSSSCGSISVTVNAIPTAPSSITTNIDNYCASQGGTLTLTAIGGSGLTVNWFDGSCGALTVGSGTVLNIPAPTQTTTYFARWQGTCGTSLCASRTITVIPIVGDFDNTGGIDGSDVEAFFAAWELGDPSADVNQDGGVDGQDVGVFFTAWEAGSC